MFKYFSYKLTSFLPHRIKKSDLIFFLQILLSGPESIPVPANCGTGWRFLPHKNTIPHNTTRHNTIPHNTTRHYHTTQYHKTQYHTIPLNTIPLNIIPLNIILHNTMPHNTTTTHNTIPHNTIPKHISTTYHISSGLLTNASEVNYCQRKLPTLCT